MTPQVAVAREASSCPPLSFFIGAGAIISHSGKYWMARDQWWLVPC